MRILRIIALILVSNSLTYAQQTDDLAVLKKDMIRIYNETYDADKGIKTAKAVLKQTTINSELYFETLFYLGDWYIINHNKPEIEILLQEMEQHLKQVDENEFKTTWTYWFYLKSRYNSVFTCNTEKAVVFGTYAFYRAKSSPKLLQKVGIQAAIGMSGVAQYDAAKGILKIYQLSKGLHRKSELEKCKYYLQLGSAYYEAEDFAEAKNYLEKAIDICKPQQSTSPELYAACLYAFAKLENHAASIRVMSELLNDGNRDYKYLAQLGKALSLKNRSDEALPLLQEALTKVCPTFSSLNLKDNPSPESEYIDNCLAGFILEFKLDALQKKGQTFIQKGQIQEGVEYLKQSLATGTVAIQLYHRMIDEMVGFEVACLIMNESSNLIMGKMIKAAFALQKQTQTQKDLDYLFKLMEQRRGLSILQQTTKSPIPEHLLEAFKQYSKKIEHYELQFTITTDLSFSILKDISELILEYEVYFEELKQENTPIRLTPDDFQYINIADFQATLDDETIFIQYAVVLRKVFALSITKNSVKTALVYQNEEEMIERQIYPFIDLIKNPFIVQKQNHTAFIEKSNYFYKILIEPFETEMNGKKRFIVSAERELLFLPYEILLKNTDFKPFHELDYLVKSFEINYRYSATLHQKIQQRPAIQDYSMLAFAPVFEDGQGTAMRDRTVKAFQGEEYSVIDRKQFAYLPYTLKEVQNIERLLSARGHSTMLLRAAATKNNLIANLTMDSYQFIHIATHSMVNFGDPRLSAIACYHKADNENLYFSSDINHISIRADLVILSSCESGIGRIIDGEGIIGLNRSFIASGARNVLFSLWKVSDVHSSELMIHFYEAYLQTSNYTTALHQAKLKMLEHEMTANPRYWAAFVLIGE